MPFLCIRARPNPVDRRDQKLGQRNPSQQVAGNRTAGFHTLRQSSIARRLTILSVARSLRLPPDFLELFVARLGRCHHVLAPRTRGEMSLLIRFDSGSTVNLLGSQTQIGRKLRNGPRVDRACDSRQQRLKRLQPTRFRNDLVEKRSTWRFFDDGSLFGP